jgi:hypothetical protein
MGKISKTFTDFRSLIYSELDSSIDSEQAEAFANKLNLEFLVDPTIEPLVKLAEDAEEGIPDVDNYLDNVEDFPKEVIVAYNNYKDALSTFQNIVDRYYGDWEIKDEGKE